ncbi:MAG TPA: M1 family metallopeptidase [Burkholderiaceae bacterium]|nr:M1 family metallopeptidase [Burkholderiaceae bacterium]
MNTSKLLLSALAAAFPLNAALADTAPPAPFSFESMPGRLPKNVVPTDYSISLTPNVAKHALMGTESIALTFTEATDTIQFNSLNQSLSHVMLDGKPVKSVHSDNEQQLTTVKLPKPAAVGHHTLSFSYVGKIETEPRGMFAQEYVKPDGGKGVLLTTQFESTDARRMFPCWDEPVFRATYQLSATMPVSLTAVSNMPIAKRVVHGALATTIFERSPVMASYLVEYSAGDLAKISAESNGTKLNVYAIKSQEQDGKLALANTQQILADYNDYFGVPFPLPKLDSIAVPGGFTGAMENWGAITYNDQLLLITPSGTMEQRQEGYSVQAHEMAHQWFGDLVTMGWWDELWLNESFASWRAAKETDMRNPDWHWWESEDRTKEDAMAADARMTSHAILQHVTNEMEANTAFDPSITYNKGQSVLRMLEAYLGPDTFRDGIRRYMKARAFSNSTSTDLWQALSAASGKDVATIAASWTSQPGFPLVSVNASCDATGKRTISLSQKRFLLQGADATAAHWTIPLRIRNGADGVAQSVLLTQDGQQVEAGRCGETLSVNADVIGYYRVAYDDATLQANIRGFASMRSGDRIALLDDQWAQVEAGTAKLPTFLALASAMGTEQNQRAWEKITNVLGTIEHDERGTAGHDAFVTYARSVIKPLATQMGWDGKAGETPGIQRLRRTVIGDLGAWGDPEVIAEARQRFARFIADRNTIVPDDQSVILSIIARNAGPAEFEQLHAIAKDAKNETELRRFYSAMMNVRNQELATKAVDIALSPEIPKQADMLRADLVFQLSGQHPELSWTTFTKNADRLLAPMQPNGPFMVAQYGPEVYWNAVPLDQLETWIKTYVPAEMATTIAHGMEAAHFKLAEKTMLVNAADAFINEKATARN